MLGRMLEVFGGVVLGAVRVQNNINNTKDLLNGHIRVCRALCLFIAICDTQGYIGPLLKGYISLIGPFACLYKAIRIL